MACEDIVGGIGSSMREPVGARGIHSHVPMAVRCCGARVCLIRVLSCSDGLCHLLLGTHAHRSLWA